MTVTLDQAWAKLSTSQRQAASWGGGPLLVLAGPGAGKTRVLTTRLARILLDTPSDKFRLLALTFTNKAADEMRTRIRDLAVEGMDRLFIGTFHSFAADVLRQHGSHVGVKPNFDILSSESEIAAIMKDCAKGQNVSAERDYQSIIKKLRGSQTDPQDARLRFKDSSLGEECQSVYEAYDRYLSEQNALDFDSIIFRVNKLLTAFPAFASRFASVYRYVCVDEFQDTNPSQYSLVKSIGIHHKNVFAVGDDDQIIYQWNGASTKRIDTFVSDFGAEVLQLPDNFRCPQEIVFVANRLIKNNFKRFPSKSDTRSASESVGEITLLGPFESENDECQSVAQSILERPAQELGACAVLARNRKLIRSFCETAKAKGLPAVLVERKAEFESTPFVWLTSFLRLANSRLSREALVSVCGAFAQLSGVVVDPEEVSDVAEATQRDLFVCWLEQSASPEVGNRVPRSPVKIGLAESLDYLEFIRQSLQWFKDIATLDGTKEAFAGYEEELGVWQELQAQVTRSLGKRPSLGAFVQELRLASKQASPKPDSIQLMTIHQAKGKEFDSVYVIGMVEDEFPAFQAIRAGDESPEMEEERRSCFVAITRAKKHLTLSCAKRYRGWGKLPSRFVAEMGFAFE